MAWHALVVVLTLAAASHDAAAQPLTCGFQIVNPASGRIIAKSRYEYVAPGRRACILRYASGAPSSTPGGLLLLLLLGAVTIASAWLWHTFDTYWSDRQRTRAAMQGFADRFVCEFEQGLLSPAAQARPIRSHVHASPDRGRLEIRLAPVGGRRYPNLSDHRDNVLYDVGRVLQQLRDRAFVCAPLYGDGAWVVIPFQFRPGSGQAGVS